MQCLGQSQKHDAVHLLIERSGRARYSKLAEATASVQLKLNQQLGDGAHFYLKETKGFYVGSEGATKATKLRFDDDDVEADVEGDAGDESDDEHDLTT